MQRRLHYDRPRYVSLAVRGDTPVLWKVPASYRVISYGDLAQEDRRLRWIVRRWAAAVLLIIGSYILASGPWLAAVRTNSIPSTGLPAEIITVSFMPLTAVRQEFRTFHHALLPWDQLCEAMFVQPSATGGSQPTALWWLWVAVWIVGAYALSPVPVWFAACLCAIERQPMVTSVMSAVFAPLIVLAEFSRTVRRFYESYGDWREAMD